MTRANTMAQYAIIIPAYQPDERLIQLVTTLRSDVNFETSVIVVVNDGSGKQFDSVFKAIAERVILLEHSENKGKGAALKTAFKFLATAHSDLVAAVTIDADGQHTVADMTQCLLKHQANQAEAPIVLGSRQFDGKVPLRSKFGNLMTRDVLAVSTGLDITDTQTGLRVIPSKYFEPLCHLPGERYEFEMQMLVFAKEQSIELLEVPIQTIYLNENESSHFNAIKDSFRIYKTFIKYLVASLSSFLVDIGIFSLIIFMLKAPTFTAIMISSYVARFFSSIFNYVVNKKVVFKAGDNWSKVKYFALVVVQGSISGILVNSVHQVLQSMSVSWIKLFVDITLFFASFYIQKKFVFTKK